jgi:LPS sulfotransferase NodH
VLCDLLSSTGVLGHPDEFLHHVPPDNANFPERFQRSITPNGVFGAKLLYPGPLRLLAGITEHHPYAPGHFANVHEDLRDILPQLRYVHLIRRETDRQAMSWIKARQTQMWHSTQKGKTPPPPPVYSIRNIDQLAQEIEQTNEQWSDYFAVNQVKPLVLYYEEMSTDFPNAVHQVADFLGISLPHLVQVPEKKRLANRHDETVLQAYRQAKLAETRFEALPRNKQNELIEQVEEQLKDNRPDEFKEAFALLRQQQFSTEEAIHRLAHILADQAPDPNRNYEHA